MSYTTKQQQAVLRCLEQRQGEPLTAADLAQALRQDGCPVGLATIYRQLEKLTLTGQVHKINTAEGAFFHLCGHAGGHRDCVLLKCSRCGRVRHVDCTHLQSLYDHLEREHHFRIDPRGTGLKVDRYNTLLSILTALTIVLGMRMMGAMLISSLVIFPALTAMRLFKSFRGVVVCAAVTSVACFCTGLVASFTLSTPVGASVVVANLTLFLLSCLASALRRR